MPTPVTAKWPKPKNEDEFEDIVTDYLRIRWNDQSAKRYGRRGQSQSGVDVVCEVDDGLVAAQIKNTNAPTLAMVQQDVEKAKALPGELSEFLFVTAAERDTNFQAAVWQYYGANPVPFKVEIVFWPDITGELSAHPKLVAKYWKGFPAGGVSLLTVLVLVIAGVMGLPIANAVLTYVRQAIIRSDLHRIQRVAEDIDRKIDAQLIGGEQEDKRPRVVEYRDAAGTCLGKDHWEGGRLVRRVLFQPDQRERCERIVASDKYIYQSDDPKHPLWQWPNKKIREYPDELRRITLRDEFTATGMFKAKEHCAEGFGREACLNGTMIEDDMRSELPPLSIMVPPLSVTVPTFPAYR